MPGPESDVVWEKFIEAGDNESPAAFYCHVNLRGLSASQLNVVKEQATQVLERHEHQERAILSNTFGAIRDACTRRLARQNGTVFLIRAAPHASDPLSQIEDDRGTVIALALAFSEHDDPSIGAIWKTIAGSFSYLGFTEGRWANYADTGWSAGLRLGPDGRPIRPPRERE